MTSYTTFDPLKNTGTLSNGNLTVAQNGNDTGAAGLFSDAKQTGKFYYEMTLDAIGGSDNGVGFGPAGGYDTVAQIAAGPRNGVVMYTNDGHLHCNASDHGAIGPATPAAGDVIAIAADFDHAKVWMKNITQGGNWNANGSADPATNTGGFDLPTGNFSWVPYATFSTSSTQTTANFGATAFSGSVPSGFTSGWTGFGQNIYVEYSNQGGTNNTATSGTIAVSTGGSSRVIVLQVTTCESATAGVNSVTDAAGLTWHGLAQNVVNDGTSTFLMSIWWAEAPAQLTNDTITINFDSCRTQAFNVISVVGAANPSSPWDANGSLPAASANPGLGGSVPTVTGVSTNDGNVLLMEFINTRQPTEPIPGAGFSLVGPSTQEPSSGPNRSYEVLGYSYSAAALSSVSVVGGNSLSSWGIMALAIPGRTGEFGDWISTDSADTMALVGHPGFSGVVGDLTATEARDAFAATGFQSNSGLLFTVETPDHFSAFGFQPLRGVLAAVGSPDVMHAVGIGRGEDGVLVATEAVDILVMVGNTPISGSFVPVESPDRFLALGAGVSRVRRRRTLIVT